jgi:hypothetical protein
MAIKCADVVSLSEFSKFFTVDNRLNLPQQHRKCPSVVGIKHIGPARTATARLRLFVVVRMF